MEINTMGIVEYTAQGLLKEIDKVTQEFYEFVMPAIDMYEDENNLIIKIDIPGFNKDNITIKIIDGNIIYIKATRTPTKEKEVEGKEPSVFIHYIQRPTQIDKRIPLPISINNIESTIETAKYVDGVLTLRIPIPESAIVPIA